MIDLIAGLFQWATLVGFILGLLAQRGYCYGRAWWLNRHRPLPGGRRRHATRLDLNLVGRAIALCVVAYCVFATQSNADEVRDLNKATRECQRQFFAALTARNNLTSENDQLSLEQRELLSDANDAQNSWLRDLLAPTRSEIAALDVNDPVRQRYALERTEVYFETTNQITAKIAALQAEQRRIFDARQQHPLPEPTCGR